VEPLKNLAGQSRAQEAVRFGLGITAEGYNIAVSGPALSGRSAVARIHVAEAAAARPPAPDWCYLYNFGDPRRPRAVSLPPGAAGELERALGQLVTICKAEIPRAFDAEAYVNQAQRTVEPFTRQREAALQTLEQTVRAIGFALNPSPMGLIPVPCLKDGTPMTQEQFNSLPDADRAAIERRSADAQDAIGATGRQLRHLEADASAAVEAVDREITRFVVGRVLDELRKRFNGESLGEHFTAVESDIVANLSVFKRFTDGFVESAPPQAVAELIAIREQILRRYQVNVFVRHDPGQQGAPVYEESHPSFANLFGRIEFENRMGTMVSDFMHARAGALQIANGGFLILQLQDILSEPRSWVMLKRALKTREVRVGDLGESLLPFPVVDLVPQGIPLDVKVVLIGEPHIFALLDVLDDDFGSLFKIRAEFEPDVDATAEAVLAYSQFVCRIRADLGLRHFTRAALEEIVQHGSRLADRQDRLTTRYGLISDLCVEANELAEAAGVETVDASHVLAALAGKQSRSGLLADRLRRLIAEGTLHVETRGAVVGQVNGLAVYQAGNYAFGTPARISCRVGPGRQGVVAIERETERSGAIHTKGVLVLSGFLAGTFGRDFPLTFNASLTFEQSYDEVEGDSASSAELYAILTALADVPVAQWIAVTGSIDQFGNVQAVGGVTEKVEGFFDLCAAVGLDGSQGVTIPSANVRSLTLRPDVIRAVDEGRFHIWALSRVEEGVELLTGIPAGTRDAQGNYPAGSVFARVTHSLGAMRQAASPPTAAS
jgi:predicted ATP-dependent protease